MFLIKYRPPPRLLLKSEKTINHRVFLLCIPIILKPYMIRHHRLIYEPAHSKSGKPIIGYTLTPELTCRISNRLQQIMQEARPFLKLRYTIRSLAADIQVESYQLSAYLNREKQIRYNDYLNQFRVHYCEDLIQKGMVNDLNMKGLALTCGFQNRNTLTTAFKKFTGQTPSGYLKCVRTGAGNNQSQGSPS